MKTKDITIASILLALGLVLHSVTPAIFGGVKPDFLLAAMFIAIITQPRFANTLLIACVAGILAAMTTSFPGGQLPNIIDKLITGFFVLGYIRLLNNNLNLIKVGILGFVATFISGFVFLGSALLIVGLPAPFSALIIAVVLPTAFANIVVSTLLYKAYTMSHKQLQLKVVAK